MRDKDLREMTTALFPCASQLVLTQPDNPRAATLGNLEGLVPKEIDSKKVILEPSATAALRRAYEVTPAAGLICVTGSLYLIGEIQTILNQNADEQFAKYGFRH
jgi:dihydrofolate synthase/folylpolyglutamate synthase